ncbi:MAG: hypothetical protein HKO57_10115, partial [Akkermansiaceae bacterium]|nr:hypothetical protein [Akkermansiaceae bacterium]
MRPPIEYVLPTSRSLAGMKRVLFQPFDLGKWFVLGFTAWLAGLADGGGSSGGGGGGGDVGAPGEGTQTLDDVLRDAGDWIEAHLAIVIGVGLVILAVVIAVAVALLWVS